MLPPPRSSPPNDAPSERSRHHPNGVMPGRVAQHIFRCMNPAVAHMIARQRHAGQRTRFGEPVVMHVERVAAAVTTDAQSVAYLHDVLEHTDMTLGELRTRGLEPSEA